MLMLVAFDSGSKDDFDRHLYLRSILSAWNAREKTLNRTSQDAFVFALMLVKVGFGLHL